MNHFTRWYRLRDILGVAVLWLISGWPLCAAVNLIIDNQSGQDIWLQWTGMSSLTGTVNAAGGGTISIASSDYNDNAAGYALSSFATTGTANQYEISNYSQAGGRLWFTMGSSGFSFNNTGYTPPLANFNDPNFLLRYDKIEASITGSTDDNMNMTSLDGFSIPFMVTAYNSAHQSTTTQTLKGSSTDQILAALGAVAANTSAPAPLGGYPAVTSYSPYLVINSNSAVGTSNSTPVGSSGNFVRVIANDQLVAAQAADPVVTANSGQIPANYLYGNAAIHLAKMDGTGANPFVGTTSISGQFAGLGDKATNDTERKQDYALTATFNATEQVTMLNKQGVSTTYTGVVTLTGSTTLREGANNGVTHHVTIKIAYAQILDPTGMVGANAGYKYTYDGGATWLDTGLAGPQNNVFTWLSGDLLAGMNIGTVGSDKLFSGTINGHTYTNVKVGEIASQDWFWMGKALAAEGQSVYDFYYSALQDSPDFYNAYSAALYKLSDAYGFAYGERIQGGSVAVSWNASQPDPVDTIVITILPDVTLAAPEPGTASLLLVSLGGWVMARRQRRREA